MARMQGTNRSASDACKPLIELYKALQKGWIPPAEVSEADYQNARDGKCEPHLQAFIGFGCSFAGKWFGGYARSGKRNYAANARNSLLRKMQGLQSVTFTHADYREIEPKNWLVYCDPPYEGTTQYGAVDGFNWVEFWETIRKWSMNNKVFISSYRAPEDFEVAMQWTTKLDIRSGNGKEPRIERVFRWKRAKEGRVAL